MLYLLSCSLGTLTLRTQGSPCCEEVQTILERPGWEELRPPAPAQPHLSSQPADSDYVPVIGVHHLDDASSSLSQGAQAEAGWHRNKPPDQALPKWQILNKSMVIVALSHYILGWLLRSNRPSDTLGH